MLKKIVALLLCCVLLVGCGPSDIPQGAGANNSGTDSTQEEANLAEDYLCLADGVSPEMLHADFWISKLDNPNEVRMTADEITEWNQNYEETCEQNLDGFYDYDEEDEPGAISGIELKYLMENSFYKPTATVYDENGSVITDIRWKTLENNRNFLGLQERNIIRYGVTVARESLRMLPYGGIVTAEEGNFRVCELQTSSILMNEPVMILHTSTDREWYFILCSYTMGWIPAESVAICESKEQWQEIRTCEEFLLVTGDKEILEVDNGSEKASELVLYMGTKCELVKYEDYDVTDAERLPYECYIIKIPTRNDAGKLCYEYAFVPASRDVHVGYLQYTAVNILEQLFKVNGDRYGWGGMYNARDCSQYALEVYRCFGLYIGRNSATQAAMPTTTYDLVGMSNQERLAVFEQLAPGALVYFPGHIMLYLGEDNGEHYVISALGSFVPASSETGEIVSGHTCMITTLSTKRASGKTWFEAIEKVKVF